MKSAKFNLEGIDDKTFKPFVIEDTRDTEDGDIRLSFDDWDWLEEKHEDAMEEFSPDGDNLAELLDVLIAHHKLPIKPEAWDNNSESGTFYIHFQRLEDAESVASIFSETIKSKRKFLELIRLANGGGSDDGEDD